MPSAATGTNRTLNSPHNLAYKAIVTACRPWRNTNVGTLCLSSDSAVSYSTSDTVADLPLYVLSSMAWETILKLRTWTHEHPSLLHSSFFIRRLLAEPGLAWKYYLSCFKHTDVRMYVHKYHVQELFIWLILWFYQITIVLPHYSSFCKNPWRNSV